jgi:hypothetical protein
VKKISFLVAILVVAFGGMRANAQVKWTRKEAPTDVTITGGPWTLEQSGAANGLKSSGYCDASGNQIGNPGTERMEPYYFPEVFGFGKHLQGYFDWRPKDTDEGVVAASSDDAGQSWSFPMDATTIAITETMRTTRDSQIQPRRAKRRSRIFSVPASHFKVLYAVLEYKRSNRATSFEQCPTL